MSTEAFLMSILQQGFSRLFRAANDRAQRPEDYHSTIFDDTFVLIDRLSATEETRQRLVDSLEICFREGHSAS